MKDENWYEKSLNYAKTQLSTVIRDIEEDVVFNDMRLDRAQAIGRLNIAINVLALADSEDLFDLDGDLDG
ncbi:hypothetical protein M3B96_10615 [Corynebacterium propinquum]|uniref:hypothetical protein n=1 Tax=Corynebacterium propinquum TaxID=43769 RepID=UPI00223B8854|nr:hypothetical protein [Corynebacterium propinquum]MCT1819391.1 hypothetical protein [Corynebacterium propinquum]